MNNDSNNNEIGQSNSSQITQNPEIVVAKGNITIKITSIIVAGILALVLLLGGLYAFLNNPTESKDLWLIIGPIISGAISGLIGYGMGKKSK